MFAADFMHFFPIMPAIVENKVEMRKNFSGAGGLLTNPLLKNVIKGIKYASYLGFTADFRVFAWGRPWNPIRVFPTGGVFMRVTDFRRKKMHKKYARPAGPASQMPAGPASGPAAKPISRNYIPLRPAKAPPECNLSPP